MIKLGFLSASALALLVISLFKKDRLNTWLTLILTLAILFRWFMLPPFAIASLTLYLLAALMMIFSFLFKKGPKKEIAWAISSIGLFILITKYFQLAELPFANEMTAMGLLPILLVLVVFRKRQKSIWNYCYLVLVVLEFILQIIFWNSFYLFY